MLLMYSSPELPGGARCPTMFAMVGVVYILFMLLVKKYLGQQQ